MEEIIEAHRFPKRSVHKRRFGPVYSNRLQACHSGKMRIGNTDRKMDTPPLSFRSGGDAGVGVEKIDGRGAEIQVQ